jgi:hypothetical protein
MRAPLSSLLLAAACLAEAGCASKPPEATAAGSTDLACATDASNSLHLTSQSSQPVERDAANKSESASASLGGSAVVTNSAAAGGGVNGATAPTSRPGSDNEIIARRLKMAAEQETNPSLHAKLWKEYTDYLQGASAK